MARVIENHDIQPQKRFGQPGKQRGTVFAIGVGVVQGFQREQVIFLMELLIIGLIGKCRLHETQQVIHRFLFAFSGDHRTQLIEQRFAGDGR